MLRAFRVLPLNPHQGSALDLPGDLQRPQLLYKHFRLPGHPVADMKVQILEKIYHSSENPVNIRLHQRLRELHWIKELGTAAPYGCND